MFKFRLALIAIVLFCVSLAFSYSEIRYMMFGHIADAAILQTSDVTSTGRYGNIKHRLRVNYQLTDIDGAKRTEYDTVPTDWPLGSDKTVAVEFIPHSDSSRLVGNTRAGWLFVFGAMLLALIGGGFWLWKSR